ncbi:MAG: diguanylate cyclase [Pseudorhodoplanes sp.]|uniref:diguanylate cyclase n=1 Tax=Pseudorhodoplanes sp. TaxID=1934341 RepID=UPI003D14FC25
MENRRLADRYSTLQRGRLVFDDGQTLSCSLRNLSTNGACLQVDALNAAPPVSIPETFDLILDGDEPDLRCSLVWQSGDRVGVRIETLQYDRDRATATTALAPRIPGDIPQDLPGAFGAGALIRLMSALDQIAVGIVLLDHELRAEFINRAFRRMWRLPDSVADARPSFDALLRHGWDTHAYEISEIALAAYIAQRKAQIRSGSPLARDLRLQSGEVVRLQCTGLPSGGRMLTYTYVTDIVRYTDKLEVLRSALDQVEQGVVLLDPHLNAQFMNRAARRLWNVPDEVVARQPAFSELVSDARVSDAYGLPPETLDAFIETRIDRIRSGDTRPSDVPAHGGRTIRSQCAVLPEGGRMITYTDVTDLVRQAEELTRLATTDGMTGLFNRRHFQHLAEMEWSRFQRYHRSLSLLTIDIDRFKSINDRNGHDVGDLAIVHVAQLLARTIRRSDSLGRLGGDEFMMLLPESDLQKAMILGARLCEIARDNPLVVGTRTLPITLSIGAAEATLSQPDISALIKRADEGLYLAKARGRDQVAAVAMPTLETNIAAE